MLATTPHRARLTSCLPVVMLALLTGACGAGPAPTPAAPPPSPAAAAPGPTSSGPPRRTITDPYMPIIDPANFTTTIDNPYFPLIPGTRSITEGNTADGPQRTVAEVTRQTRKVMGVDTVVVHDTVTRGDGQPEEDTYDWYAQDKQGNIWYFGEATKKLGSGGVDTKGSFEAGVGGALPGIVMPADPQVGDKYRQEYAKGTAEDTAEVLSRTGTETVPLGAFRDLVVTKDVNSLDPTGAVENKYFAKGVGFILVVHVTGPPERVALVRTEKF